MTPKQRRTIGNYFCFIKRKIENQQFNVEENQTLNCMIGDRLYDRHGIETRVTVAGKYLLKDGTFERLE